VRGGRFNIRLRLVDELLFGRVYPNPASRAAAMARIREMKEEARKRAGGQHRAGPDVRYLVELYRIATNDE
jgi:hypothetical protein